jgi:hypothetical protein
VSAIYCDRQEAAVAPCHLLFSAEGLPIWGRDAIGFFDAYLRL